MRRLLVLAWLILCGSAMVSDQYRMVEKQRIVYTGTITIGKLRLTTNSFNGFVVQIARISESEPKHDLQIPTNVDCPCGYRRAYSVVPGFYTSSSGGMGTSNLSQAQAQDCEPDEESETAKHLIEIPKDDIPQVIDVLNHFKKELNTAQNAVIDDGAKP